LEGPAVGGVALEGDLRVEVRLRDPHHRARFLDPRGGEREILVVHQRRPDEVLQDWIPEHLPPGNVGDRVGLVGLGKPVLRRRHRLGSFVIRSEGAGRKPREEGCER
jgi:hypothetical protein